MAIVIHSDNVSGVSNYYDKSQLSGVNNLINCDNITAVNNKLDNVFFNTTTTRYNTLYDKVLVSGAPRCSFFIQ